MSNKKITNLVHRTLSNLFGWYTKHKIIVIESDDWGSIRMPSKEAFCRLKTQGVDLESFHYERYNQFDTLANRQDLESLFEVLSKFKDKNSNPCCFTALSLVANPDFKKIEENNFNYYYYEPFTRTLERYYNDNQIFNLWLEGISKRIFIPQFHGREHLNVNAWLNALQSADKHTHYAFNEKAWGFVSKSNFTKEYQAAFQIHDSHDILSHKLIIKDGLDLFESIFGYRASYFVPPNGPINNKLNETLFDNGIKFRSTARLQHESVAGGKYRLVIHWLGQKDKSGIRYITRNCFFEPSSNAKSDWVDSCLFDIDTSFKWNKPAIISSHRVNYIGALDIRNRKRGLTELNKLMGAILKKWPDVEFMTTDKLGELLDL